MTPDAASPPNVRSYGAESTPAFSALEAAGRVRLDVAEAVGNAFQALARDLDRAAQDLHFAAWVAAEARQSGDALERASLLELAERWQIGTALGLIVWTNKLHDQLSDVVSAGLAAGPQPKERSR